jgi:hypothetical protein
VTGHEGERGVSANPAVSRQPSCYAEELRRRGHELAAQAPPLTSEQREQIRNILRGVPIMTPEQARKVNDVA